MSADKKKIQDHNISHYGGFFSFEMAEAPQTKLSVKINLKVEKKVQRNTFNQLRTIYHSGTSYE